MPKKTATKSAVRATNNSQTIKKNSVNAKILWCKIQELIEKIFLIKTGFVARADDFVAVTKES